MTTNAVPARVQGSGAKGVIREKTAGIRLVNRIDAEIDRMMKRAETQRYKKADVVWTERSIAVLLAGGVALAATGVGMVPLIFVASLLGICVIAYAIIRLKIHFETTAEYEMLRKQLKALESAIWGKVPNPERASTILEGIVLNRGLEFRHHGRIDNPTVEELESRMPQFCRALIRDIVRGPDVDDPVVGKNAIAKMSTSGSTKVWNPYDMVNRLAETNMPELKKHPQLFELYLEGRFEEAMVAQDPRLLDDLPGLQEECRKQLPVKPSLGQYDLKAR